MAAVNDKDTDVFREVGNTILDNFTDTEMLYIGIWPWN
jgi:hypothetical protein